MLRRLVQDQWYCTRGDSCIWGLDCNTREQRACDKHPFLPEPPLKISEEKRKLSSSSPLKLPQEPNCSATAECLSCRPPSPSGTWGGHVWRPLSVSVSLCLSLRVMSRVEQLCNDSCTTACAPDSVLYPLIGAFGVAKSVSHLGLRVFSVPWRMTAGAMWAPFLSLSLPTQRQCIKSPGSRTRPCKSRAACLPTGLVSQRLDNSWSLWAVWQDRRNWSPAFISALWGQLPTCAPQGIWACGCLVHEPYQV